VKKGARRGKVENRTTAEGALKFAEHEAAAGVFLLAAAILGLVLQKSPAGLAV